MVTEMDTDYKNATVIYEVNLVKGIKNMMVEL